jgi:hypothetical protein
LEEGDVPSIAKTLRGLEVKKAEKAAEQERLLAESATNAGDTLSELREAAAALTSPDGNPLPYARTVEKGVKRVKRVTTTATVLAATPGGEERERLRERIKSKVRLLVERIWVKAEGKTGKGTIDVLIHFRNGRRRLVVIQESPPHWMSAAVSAETAAAIDELLAEQDEVA